jgi:hypothetical protein
MERRSLAEYGDTDTSRNDFSRGHTYCDQEGRLFSEPGWGRLPVLNREDRLRLDQAWLRLTERQTGKRLVLDVETQRMWQ